MAPFVEPYVLFLFGCCLFNGSWANVSNISLLFAMLALVSLQIVIRNNYLRLAFTALAVVLSLIFPQIVVFMPACAYSLLFAGKYNYGASFIIPIVYKLISNPEIADIKLVLLACFCVYLAYEASQKNTLMLQVKTLRDNAVEHEIALRNQNAKLVESQDNQIYIATLQERNRIAREIHDNVGHMLSSSILQVGALLAVTKDENVKALLSVLKDTLNNAMNNIRNSVHDLHDESVDLNQAITSLCNDFSFCPVNLICETSKTIPKDIKYTFISITKEALNNIMKHSNATKVDVTIKEHPGFYQLLIHDNGDTAHNLKITEDNLKGIGITNIRDRVKALNGIVNIQADNGFKIFISIPK